MIFWYESISFDEFYAKIININTLVGDNSLTIGADFHPQIFCSFRGGECFAVEDINPLVGLLQISLCLNRFVVFRRESRTFVLSPVTVIFP